MSREKVIIVKDTRSIRKKPWIVRWYGEYDPTTGKQKRYSKSFRTRAQAEHFQGQKQGEFDQGDLRDPQNISLGELCSKFMASRKHTLRATTQDGYEDTIIQLLGFFSPTLNIKAIRSEDAERFIGSRKIVHPNHVAKGKELSAWSRNKHLRHSRKIFKTAVSWQYLRQNPFDGIEACKADKKSWYHIEPAQFKLILDKAPNLRTRVLYAVQYGCGLRYGEAINLLWDGQNIDFERCRINIVNRCPTAEMPPFAIKDHETRSLPIPQWVVQLLLELHETATEGCPFVFLTGERWQRVKSKWRKMVKGGKGKQWANSHVANNVLRCFKDHCRAAGIKTNEKLNLHCLRKSYAQNLADAGTPAPTLKKLMGHSSLRVTEEFYLRSSDANEQRACEALDRIMQAQLPTG